VENRARRAKLHKTETIQTSVSKTRKESKKKKLEEVPDLERRKKSVLWCERVCD
jgi:hypothetical protein